MSNVLYTRKAKDGYEFGHIKISEVGTKQETRVHVPLGTRPTIEAALSANNMAMKGAPRIGNHHNVPLWRD